MNSETFTLDTKVSLPRGSGAGSLRAEKGLFVMHLHGTPEEMGRQNAELASGIVDDSVAIYYLDFIEKMARHALGHSSSLPGPAAAALYSLFTSLNRKRIGDGLKGLIKGYTDVFGLPASTGERLAVFADILHFLAGKSYANIVYTGCSGFFARGAATEGGRMVIGRNFDFFGRGIYNTNQCLTVFHPVRGKPYFWLGSLGLPVGGFGMNGNGIGLMIFTNFSRDVSVSGMPLFTLCNEVLENAENLEQAIEIVTSRKRMSANSLLITDSRARDAAAIGFSANRFEVMRPEGDVLVRTNHYLTEQMQAVENCPVAWKMHSGGRFARIHEVLVSKRGAFTPRDASSLLGDAYDVNERRHRVVGDIVGAVNNALSIVVDPDAGTIHIANGGFPVCNSDTYHGFDIGKLLSGADEADAADLKPDRRLSDDEVKAVAHYQEAWSDHLDRFDDARAVYNLRRAAEYLPDEPIFDRLSGILLMKMGRAMLALPHLEKNAEYAYTGVRMRAESALWHARCLDLLGKRGAALEHYARAASEGDAEISAAATRHINVPFNQNEMRHVSVEFVVGCPIAKYA